MNVSYKSRLFMFCSAGRGVENMCLIKCLLSQTSPISYHPKILILEFTHLAEVSFLKPSLREATKIDKSSRLIGNE